MEEYGKHTEKKNLQKDSMGDNLEVYGEPYMYKPFLRYTIFRNLGYNFTKEVKE